VNTLCNCQWRLLIRQVPETHVTGTVQIRSACLGNNLTVPQSQTHPVVAYDGLALAMLVVVQKVRVQGQGAPQTVPQLKHLRQQQVECNRDR
jgi:hypothetical protein